MKVEIKKVDPTRRELRFEIPKERVSRKLEEVYKEIGKVAKVKGFRQGKVPRNILETHHAETAKEETIKKIIPEVYQEGIQEQNITPIDLPEIHNVSFKDGVITFTAKLDIRPEIKIKSYKGIKLKRKSTQVTDEELNKTLEYFKKGKGDEKEKALDDEFARGLGFPGLEDFKSSLRRQMEIDKDRHNRMDVENQVLDYLIKNTSFAVPQSVVQKQVVHRLEEAKKHMKSQGSSEEDLKKKEDELRKELQPAAERDIKAYFILGKIAELENIKVEHGQNLPGKVMEFLFKEAQWEEVK